MIEIGDKITFQPSAFFSDPSCFGAAPIITKVTGWVVYVNQEHRFYRVAYKMPGCIGHECFKF